MPRPPDWVIYLGIVLALLAASLGRREPLAAPSPPPPVPGADQAPIPPTSPFADAALVHMPGRWTNRGTAFAVSDRGVWLTAAGVVGDCHKVVVMVADGWAAPAKVAMRSGDAAVLTTQAGAPALAFARGGPSADERAFLPGFSRGVPGEAAALYLGGAHDRTDWAETGRTDGLEGPLDGFAGAPVLDAGGRIAGMALADAPRRGRIEAASPAALTAALGAAHAAIAGVSAPQPITKDNYGRAADALRRATSVVPVECL